MLQLVKAGDIDFAIISSANTATISPQAGVMSLHFLFRDDDHVIKGLADPRVFEAIRTMIDETTQGLHVIGTGSQGVRHMYSKKEIKNVGDIKGLGDLPRQANRRRARLVRKSEELDLISAPYCAVLDLTHNWQRRGLTPS